MSTTEPLAPDERMRALLAALAMQDDRVEHLFHHEPLFHARVLYLAQTIAIEVAVLASQAEAMLVAHEKALQEAMECKDPIIIRGPW